MTREEKFREKINWISIICAILVVFLHSFSYAKDNYEPPNIFAYKLEFLISRDLAQAAVPVFFAMSGFLFYRRFTVAGMGEKLKGRFLTLVIPYLIWNTIYTAVFFFLAKLPFVNTTPFELNLDNLIQGILFQKYNGAFWFLFNLIQLTYLCPIVYLMLKNRWIGLLFLGLMSVLYGMDITVMGWLEIRTVVYYGVGAYAAIHHRDAVVNAQGFHWSGAAALILSQIMLFWYDNIMLCYILTRVLMIVAAFWFANFLPERKLPRILLCSFPIYAIHGLILETFNKVFSFFLDTQTNWILIDYFGSVIMTVSIIIVLNQVLLKRLPKLHTILFGGRAR